MQATAMDLEHLIDQNRERTKALLMQRLLQSHRQHKDVAAKRIARRRAIRYLINTSIAVPVLVLLVWTAMNYFGVEIIRVQAPGNDSPAQVYVSQPTATATAPSLPAMPAVAPESASTPGTTMSETSVLRFENELTTPATAKTNP